MCDPISAGIATAVGAGLSVIGSMQQAKAQQAQASAIAEQNRATQAAQNQGFIERLQAQLGRTAGELGANTETIAARSAAADTMRQQQTAALSRYRDVIEGENAQAERLRQVGDANQQQLLDATTQSQMADAMERRRQEAASLLSGSSTVQGPETNDPSAGGDPATAAADAKELARRATNIRDYGSKVGAVTAYGAPGDVVSNSIVASRYGIMPAQTAEQLLRSGSATRLLPTSVAYKGATTIGSAADTLAQAKGQMALQAAGLQAGNAIDLANLKQSNIDTAAANRSAQQQADAQYAAQQAGVLQSIGKLGLYGAGYFGGNPFAAYNPDTVKSLFPGANPSTYGDIVKANPDINFGGGFLSKIF